MKLFRSRNYPTRWYAFQPGAGFWMFPAEAGGWEKRQPARGLDPIDVREVPTILAAGSGMPGTDDVHMGGPDSALLEAA